MNDRAKGMYEFVKEHCKDNTRIQEDYLARLIGEDGIDILTKEGKLNCINDSINGLKLYELS